MKIFLISYIIPTAFEILLKLNLLTDFKIYEKYKEMGQGTILSRLANYDSLVKTKITKEEIDEILGSTFC